MFKTTTAVLAAALLLAPAASMAQPKGKPPTTTTVPVGGGEVTGESLVARYTSLAGSEANAKSLVNGLRSGTEVTLTAITQVTVKKTCTRVIGKETYQEPIYFGPFIIGYTTKTRDITEQYDCSTTTEEVQTSSFMPPTGTMGWGNVDIALAFTEAQLKEVGLTSPKPPQVQAALMGGEVTSPYAKATFPGILQLRASGMGWGQIADKLGFKLQ